MSGSNQAFDAEQDGASTINAQLQRRTRSSNRALPHAGVFAVSVSVYSRPQCNARPGPAFGQFGNQFDDDLPDG